MCRPSKPNEAKKDQARNRQPPPTCRARLDCKGDHYAACPRTGRLRRRAGPMEVTLRRVLREAGARVVPNAQLRNLGFRGAPRQDGRNIEAAAYGLQTRQGLPLLVDITMSSPLQAFVPGTLRFGPRRG